MALALAAFKAKLCKESGISSNDAEGKARWEAIAAAIDDYVKSATVTVTVDTITGTSPSGAVTGTGTGTGTIS